MSREADKTTRAFERALLMAPLSATYERPRKYDKPLSKKCQCVFDHARNVFKTAMEHKIQKGDSLSLEDGRKFTVDAVDPFVVEGVACYWEVKASPVTAVAAAEKPGEAKKA
jgi:hypothetical protein